MFTYGDSSVLNATSLHRVQSKDCDQHCLDLSYRFQQTSINLKAESFSGRKCKMGVCRGMGAAVRGYGGGSSCNPPPRPPLTHPYTALGPPLPPPLSITPPTLFRVKRPKSSLLHTARNFIQDKPHPPPLHIFSIRPGHSRPVVKIPRQTGTIFGGAAQQ